MSNLRRIDRHPKMLVQPDGQVSESLEIIKYQGQLVRVHFRNEVLRLTEKCIGVVHIHE